MRQIGFRTGNNFDKVANFVKVEEVEHPYQRILREQGMLEIFKYVDEYVSGRMTLLRGTERDEWLCGKLRRIRERYFETI